MEQLRPAIVFMFLNSANSIFEGLHFNRTLIVVFVRSSCKHVTANYLLPVVEAFVS